MKKVRAIVAGRAFDLDRSDVARVLAGETPEPVRDHFVVVGRRRFPPKQALAIVTGLDRLDFTTHQARAIMRRLGFDVGRMQSRQVAEPASSYGPSALGATVAHEELRRYRGKWIAIKDGLVIASGASPGEVIASLRDQGEQAQTMFRVSRPRDDEPIAFE